MMSNKKAIVIHSVSVNGGDQLLLYSLRQGLSQICDVTIELVTTNNKISYSFIPFDCCLNSEVIALNHVKSGFFRKFLSIFGWISELFLEQFAEKYCHIASKIKNSDIIILGPGGFLHDYYGMKSIFDSVKYLKKFDKKIVIIGQSVGPFEKNPEEAKALFEYIDFAILRENISERFLEKIGYTKTLVTSDIALGYKYSLIKAKNKPKNKIFLNFRPWKNIDENELLEKAAAVVDILTRKGFEIEFISTCQGVDNYVDDSEFVFKILEFCRFNDVNLDRVVNNKAKYTPNCLIQYLHDNGFIYIGMRLHMTISSILADIPVFNIYYEHKSEGIMKSLDMDENSCSIYDDKKHILNNIHNFLNSDYEYELHKVVNAKLKGRDFFNKTFNALSSLL